jgi:hypothetical protein
MSRTRKTSTPEATRYPPPSPATSRETPSRAPASLLRWYRLRLRRAATEAEGRALAAHAAAEQLTNRGSTNLTAAVKQALGEAVFAITNASADPEKIAAALTSAGHALARLDRNDIAREKIQAETGRAPSLQGKAALDPRKLYVEVATDVLKRLRARPLVRQALDPIRDELIAEFAHAPESFAERPVA